MKKLAAILLLFLSTVSAQGVDNQSKLNSQETFKILGIELGKDTIDNVKKFANEKNCRLEKDAGEDNSYLLKGCFDLPGEEFSTRYSYDEKTGKVISIYFTLSGLLDSRTYLSIQNYIEALKHRYGKPSYNNGMGVSIWEWNLPNLNITATKCVDFSIKYTSLVVTRMMKEREVNKISSQM